MVRAERPAYGFFSRSSATTCSSRSAFQSNHSLSLCQHALRLGSNSRWAIRSKCGSVTSATTRTAHPINIIGPQAFRRVHLAMHGRVDSFVVVFQPGGLSHLFSVPADPCTNQHFDGRAVLGRSVDELRWRLGESESFTETPPDDGHYTCCGVWAPSPKTDVMWAARELLRRRGGLRISSMAEQAGLSVRQFERRFMSQMACLRSSMRVSHDSKRR